MTASNAMVDQRLPIEGGPPWTKKELEAERKAEEIGSHFGAGAMRKTIGAKDDDDAFTQRMVEFTCNKYLSAVDFWYGNAPSIVNKYAARNCAKEFFLLSTAIDYASEETSSTFWRLVVKKYQNKHPDFDILKVSLWKEDEG